MRPRLRRRDFKAWFRAGLWLMPIILIGSPAACRRSSAIPPQTVGNCFGTTATRMEIPAGSNLRFAVPVTAIAQAAATLELGQTSLSTSSPWLQARARPGRALVTPEQPGVFFIDLYSTVDAAAGTIDLMVPVAAIRSGGCAAMPAQWRFTIEVLQPRRLQQAELATTAAAGLDGLLQTYIHREFVLRTGADGARRFTLVRFEEIRALHRLRNEADLTSAGSRYFADERGNIARFGEMARGADWAPLPYGVVFFAEGGSMMAIDASGDGVVDLALGGHREPAGRYGRWWIETNAFGEGFFECWAARRAWTPDLRSEVAAALGAGAPGPCSGSGGASGSGGGGVGGRFGLPGGGLLGPPDCSFSEELLGRVAGPDGDSGPTVDELLGPEQTDEEFAEMIDMVRTEMEIAAAERRAAADRADAAAAELSAARQVAEALGQAPPAPAEENVLDNAARTVERALIIHETESTTLRIEPGIRSCEGACSGLIFEGRWGSPPERVEPEGEDQDPRRGPSRQPPIGPDGTPTADFQDPRCAGIATDAARGTLFTNPLFCGGSTLLDCLRREQDSIYDITGGNCRREVGPDDASHLVCGDNRGFFPDCTPTETDPAGRRCEDRCGPGDVYCRNVVPGTGPPLLSLTPIGAVLEVICHADCPGEP